MWFFIFHTWIWSYDPWLGRRSTFCIWGNEFRFYRKRKYTKWSHFTSPPFFFLSHPVIPIYVLLFHGKQQEQYLLYCWQTTASDTDTPLPFVHLKHRLLQEKEPIWIPPSWPVCSPHLEHNIPTEKVISCSDPAPAPFITGPQQQKHKCCYRSFLPQWYLRRSRKQETWEWALGRHIPQEHLITLRLLPPCDPAWTGTEPLHHPTQRAVCSVGSCEHQGWEFRDLERLMSHEAYLSIKTWN